MSALWMFLEQFGKKKDLLDAQCYSKAFVGLNNLLTKTANMATNVVDMQTFLQPFCL